VSGFFDILIGCHSHLKLEQLTDMRDVLRKWTPREKYFNYQNSENFLTTFRQSLSRECFSEISGKSVKSVYPVNSLKVDVLLPKSNARF